MKRSIGLIILFVFIELLGYSLFLPLLPYYAESLGSTPFVTGLLIGSNALAQLLAAPLIGRLSDRLGRRPMLIFSISGTLVSFLLLGLVNPLGTWVAGLIPGLSVGTAALGLLFASRILDGLAGGNVSLARAYITDVTDERQRSRGMGLIGAAFGVGFIIGPALGGTLSNWEPMTSRFVEAGLSRYAVPAMGAVLLAALNLVGVVLWLPESLSPEERAERGESPRAGFSPSALWEALQRPQFGPLLRVRFTHRLAFAIFTTNFGLYTQYRLGLSDRSTSFVLTYVGVLVVLVQGVAVGWLTDRFQETRIILVGSTLLGLALLAWAFVPGLLLMLIVLAPLALAGGTLNTVTNSAITKSVYDEEVGGALGLSTALDSLTRIVAPAIGGFLLGQLGAWTLGALGAGLMVWTTLYIRRHFFGPSGQVSIQLEGGAEGDE
jgi:DHA1 family tetracycline resistance protein-like MFS transporter